jgi:hypothetical protein
MLIPDFAIPAPQIVVDPMIAAVAWNKDNLISGGPAQSLAGFAHTSGEDPVPLVDLQSSPVFQSTS